ncbi:MAG TPA: hypothetical protein VJ951_04725, partial [Bacteroidales bacterium]|nr:hypothetical protein [Bacteroidales bacterium]
MKQVFKKIWKWFKRLILGLLSLITIVLLLFVLFKGYIVDKAVDYINQQQPGKVKLESINLRPFRYFPDLSLRLNDLQYSESMTDSVTSMPVLELEELNVAVDLIQLIKGNYIVSRIDLGDGVINYVMGADSLTNIERALGIRFGESSESDTTINDSSGLSFELELLQIRNITVYYLDQPSQLNTTIVINGLQSGFSYYPDTII